jgi:hypothetical protein
MSACKYCRAGWLENRFGQDVECVNGVLIDIDVFTEGWPRDVAYPAAPCEACLACRGVGCDTCNDTGWRSGVNESQKRLGEAA